jgi:hypothetical protein
LVHVGVSLRKIGSKYKSPVCNICNRNC